MATTITLATITAKQAAKRVGTPRYVIETAIRKGHLSVIAYKKSYLLTVEEVDRWFENLTPTERATVVPCTRTGCFREEDKWPHDPDSITPEGKPQHRRHIADSEWREEDGTLTRVHTGESPESGWVVGIQADGEADWEIYIEVTARAFPVRDQGLYHATFPVPESPALAEAITEAIRRRDRLNSEQRKVHTEGAAR